MRGILAWLVLATSASAAPPPYVGEPVTTPATGQDVYVMFSSYKIVPYSQGYVDNALATLGRTGIPGIIYTAVGGVSDHLESRWPKHAGPAPDEVAYNTSIYEQAKTLNAKLWLQIPEYYNQVEVDGSRRNITAAEILSSDPGNESREAFKRQLQREFRAYSAFAGRDARVIVFEEAGIYHSAQGGGRFWASPHAIPSTTRPVTRPNAFYNALFAENMKGVFHKIHAWLREVDPLVEIGMHLGHQAIEDVEDLKPAIEWLTARKSRSDFIFYDLYLGPQSPRGDRWENYRQKLTARRHNISELDRQHPLPALHLGQLHTTNDFQNGRGYTPTRKELDATIALDGRDALNFDGIGYYTKNALPTDPAVSPDAYDPNSRGATTVEESSTDRWDYGITQLFEKKGADYREWFDVVLYGRFQKDAYRVYARRADTGYWQLIGRADRSLRSHYRDNEAVVFRFLRAGEFLSKGHTTLELKIEAAPGFEKGTLEAAYIIPSQPAKTFRAAHEVKADIASGAIREYVRGTLEKTPRPLGTKATEFTVQTISSEAALELPRLDGERSRP
jgi:hypothetical protein